MPIASPEAVSLDACPTKAPAAASGLSLKTALIAVLLVNAVRLAIAPFFDLAPQEAYYHLYSQHPALSYFDHPPIMAWCLWLSTAVLGKSVFTLRLTAFCMTLLTQLAFCGLARRFLPRARQPHALLLFATTAMISVVSLVSLPDVPLLLFWSLSLLCLDRAIFDGRKGFWLLAGLCMGLAFDGKYTAIFLQLGLALFLVLSPAHRRWLKTPWPYLSILVAQAAMLPVYVWNAQNDFASFLFQSADRASTWRGLQPINFLKLVGTQTALLLPPLLFGAVWAFFRKSPRLLRRLGRPARQRPLFLLCFFAPLFLGFSALSFVTLVKPNWLMPAWITGILFACLVLSPRLTRWNLGCSLVLHLALAIELLLYPVPLKTDDTWFGWETAAAEIGQVQARHPEAFLFSDDSYKTSAELAFYLDRKVYSGNVLGKPALQFDYLGDDLSALIGRDALFVDSRPSDFSPDRWSSAPPRKLARHFDSVEALDPVLVRRQGEIARKFQLWHCRGYRGPQPIAAEDRPAPPPPVNPGDRVEKLTLPGGTNVSIVIPEGTEAPPQERDTSAPEALGAP